VEEAEEMFISFAFSRVLCLSALLRLRLVVAHKVQLLLEAPYQQLLLARDRFVACLVLKSTGLMASVLTFCLECLE
jgi:hypothetical protein